MSPLKTKTPHSSNTVSGPVGFWFLGWPTMVYAPLMFVDLILLYVDAIVTHLKMQRQRSNTHPNQILKFSAKNFSPIIILSKASSQCFLTKEKIDEAIIAAPIMRETSE